MNPLIEQTLVLIKPDALKRGLAGEIIQRFEKVGLKIIRAKLVKPTESFAQKHYPMDDAWLSNVGSNTVKDCEKYGMDCQSLMGTTDQIEIGKKIHAWNVEFFTDQLILALVLEGVHAIEQVRKMAGVTLPLLAPPGSIRGDLAMGSALSENGFGRTVQNLVHTSGDLAEAKREIKLWFGKNSPEPV